jgi:hypothetical protein
MLMKDNVDLWAGLSLLLWLLLALLGWLLTGCSLNCTVCFRLGVIVVNLIGFF